MAIDDDGNTFELSADPMLKTVQPYVEHNQTEKYCDR